ncbi:hypothetical protein C4559_00915 [Candidatus Microgenomates bacterium]|nr:MAG: hypothetical protein C4559_00915 [Candidatus Microgenomates bacterium]
MRDFILDFCDQDGKRYVWKKERYDMKAKKHSELRDPSYLGRVKSVICHPDQIIPGYNEKKKRIIPNRYCYFIKEAVKDHSNPRYTVVVIDKTIDKTKSSGIEYIYVVCSSYRPDHIKELQYKIKPCKRP